MLSQKILVVMAAVLAATVCMYYEAYSLSKESSKSGLDKPFREIKTGGGWHPPI